MKNNKQMKKIIFIIVLFFGLFAQAQKLKADAIKYKAVTTTERDAFTVPAGEFWRIYNTTNNRFEYWDGDSWEAFVASGGESTTVSDTAEIDLTLTGDDLTAAIITGSVDVLKLDAGVQASLALADSALQAEIDGSVTNEIQNASQVENTPSGNLVATDVQAALNELQTEIDGYTDDQTAAEVPNTPSGNLVATDVQAALDELQTEIDGILIDDTAFGVSWNGNSNGATKNALYDYLINLEGLVIDDTAYGVSWDTNTDAATKNAIYDKIESIAGGSESTTVSDTAEIDLTLTGSDITGDIVTGSIDVLKLDSGVQTSLGLADSALQSETQDVFDIDASGYSPTHYTEVGGTDLDNHILGIDTQIGTLTTDLNTAESDITDLQSDKADKTNVLELDNTTSFTPDADYEPATKKYVDDNTYLADRIYEDATTITTQDLDYSLYEVFNFTVTGAVTFTESNLPTSGTYSKVILINITGDFALTYPANWSTNITGTYDGTVNNVIAVWYIKSGVYKVQITQPD